MLFNGDCLEVMKTLDDKSIDLVFCDLPYGQTSCKWDCKIDLVEFWKQIMRIKKLNTPIFFTTTTKFGVDLIQSAPKKCFFRYDLVWVKSAPAGFLCAKKMPMRKHEMVYVFYEKLPFYDLSRHTHKFIKKEVVVKKVERDSTYGKIETHDLKTGKNNGVARYDPPLPVSIVKEEENNTNKNSELYGKIKGNGYSSQERKGSVFDPPLPVSVLKEGDKGCYGEKVSNSEAKYGQKCAQQYDPPLPVSIVKEGDITITELEPEPEPKPKEGCYGAEEMRPDDRIGGKPIYDPPLPNTLLEIKSTRGKHSTEKPVALMSWILKYYSKEGDVVLDPTMGSGSTGVSCKEMNRNFIGIEKDPEIYEVAVNRIETEL